VLRLACAGLLALAACDPGSLYDGPVVGPDGGVTLCTPEVAPNGDGHHNPGMACMTAGCHRNGTGPTFTVAGTLYDQSRGGLPVGGATVVVVDGNGRRIELPTAANGNFWTSEPLATPFLLKATQCPADNPMVSLSQDGDCNRSGCHGTTDIRVALE
jgi:hypothetical protein